DYYYSSYTSTTTWLF
nr:immunoglobulin light chain junction region [Macaca mulatta]